MLTDKQEKFCLNIVSGMNQSDAYRNSYDNNMTDKQIWEEASKLMSKPKVSQRIEQLRKEARKDTIMSAIQRKEWLTEMIMKDVDASKSDKLKALDILNKMDGEYVEKIKAEVDITNMVVDIEDE